MDKVSIMNRQEKHKKVFFICLTIIMLGVFIFLFVFFIKAVKYRKHYEANRTYYSIFPYNWSEIVDEDPIEVLSQFRGDDKKTGVVTGEWELQGKVKPFFDKINGSLHSASKATPAVDESGIYVGSDAGWFL